MIANLLVAAAGLLLAAIAFHLGQRRGLRLRLGQLLPDDLPPTRQARRAFARAGSRQLLRHAAEIKKGGAR